MKTFVTNWGKEGKKESLVMVISLTMPLIRINKNKKNKNKKVELKKFPQKVFFFCTHGRMKHECFTSNMEQ